MLLESRPCLHCFNLTTAKLALDKKGKPFMSCVGCGARSFLPSFRPCLHGAAILTPIVQAIAEEMSQDARMYRRHQETVDSFIGGLQASIRGPSPLPAVETAATIHAATLVRSA